jgi:hypothetical protein
LAGEQGKDLARPEFLQTTGAAKMNKKLEGQVAIVTGSGVASAAVSH